MFFEFPRGWPTTLGLRLAFPNHFDPETPKTTLGQRLLKQFYTLIFIWKPSRYLTRVLTFINNFSPWMLLFGTYVSSDVISGSEGYSLVQVWSADVFD